MVNYSRNFIFQVKASLREFINLKASKSYQTMLDAVTSDTERGYSQGSFTERGTHTIDFPDTVTGCLCGSRVLYVHTEMSFKYLWLNKRYKERELS